MKRNAFTLFELMIVVVLIGTIYSLVLSNFHTKKKVNILKIQNIKEALIPYWKKGKLLELYSYDRCQQSALFINGVLQEDITPDINQDEFKRLKVYTSDYRGETQIKEFLPIMINKKIKKVCFKYTLFPNGSNSSFILEKDKRFYVFYPHFQDINITDDLSQAMDLLQQKEFKGISQSEVND